MDDLWSTPVKVSVGEVCVRVALQAPAALTEYRRHAELSEHFEQTGDDGEAGFVFVAVEQAAEWPPLVVTQRFTPAGSGFSPAVLLLPEQRQLFIGAGTRLLAYEARSGQWRRSWLDEADGGFWHWQRHADVVLMSAELELAAWTTTGEKLWTTFVEPPWSYEISAGRVVIDVMGVERRVDLRQGR